ncbi:metallophosphoesterase [Hydrogenophaga sp. NFH-34]|uniref:metallophosphoesterase n=1 Tax=Hydrogenophaga sp. NFH-34 TaxID=2744446 RepID=UPI001F2C21B1|nr:metallophosphoesterase [Hydrogenophaga sp. NFH-34]
MTINIAHFSDLHYCAENLKEADACFSAGVTAAICSGVDCAIITGDSTDHVMDAHSPAVKALAEQVRRLSDHCPVLMLQGTFSHEPQGFLRMLSMVDGKHPISVADGISQWSLQGGAFVPYNEVSIPRLLVSAMPTLNKAHIAALVADVADEASIEARGIISRVIQGWAPLNSRMRAQGIPTVVLSHGTVFNSVSEHGVPMAGNDHELGIDTLFSAGADAVMLGHIHKHQHWSNDMAYLAQSVRQIIAYAGSIGRFHYGEQGDKGWLLWELGGYGAQFELVPTPSRRNVDFVFEGPPDLDEIKQRIDECDGAHVRITYTIDEEHRHVVDRSAIRNLLANAAEVKIEGRTCIVQRQRAAGISQGSLAEKLAIWARVTETPNVNDLQERLEMISADAPEVVAEKLAARLNAA